jgi:hypothetical protein
MENYQRRTNSQITGLRPRVMEDEHLTSVLPGLSWLVSRNHAARL